MGLLRGASLKRDLQAYILILLGCKGKDEGFRGEKNIRFMGNKF